jgi:hypothetical protein
MGSYEDLYKNNPQGFELMKNSANALVLNFKPIIYDLTIPDAGKIKRLLNIYQDDFWEKIISPEEVDCCYPVYDKRNIELDFGRDIFNRVQRGLEFCINTKNKEDLMPIEFCLSDLDFFGKEYIQGRNFYRIRNGKREELENQVRDYFNKDELSKFREIAEFVQPCIQNLDKPAKVKVF